MEIRRKRSENSYSLKFYNMVIHMGVGESIYLPTPLGLTKPAWQSRIMVYALQFNKFEKMNYKFKTKQANENAVYLYRVG